jgi:hypothetical protein
MPAVQNLCVQSASKTLASNPIIPDTSESITKIQPKESSPALSVDGGVAHAELATLAPYDS